MKSFDRTTGIARGIGGMSTADAQKTACDGKGRFPSRVLAEERADRMRRRNGNERPATAYHCLFCGEWHIGGKRPVDQTATYKRKRAALRDGGGES